MRTKGLLGILSLWALVPACGNATQLRPAAPASLRIEKLSGAVVRLDSPDGYAPLGVRLRATVCVRSAEAVYPDAIGVTHFVVSRSPRRWWAARSVVDHAPWLVPLGESWNGKPCGPVVVEDPIPSDHYGVESLGNPRSCYGVELTIEAGGRRASRRAIVQCGGLHTG
jgi:hypothetical protein